MVVGALWDNGVQPFLGFILGGVIGAVAIASIFHGLRLSKKLETLRKTIAQQGPEQWGSYVPPNGINRMQFRELATSLRSRGINRMPL